MTMRRVKVQKLFKKGHCKTIQENTQKADQLKIHCLQTVL